MKVRHPSMKEKGHRQTQRYPGLTQDLDEPHCAKVHNFNGEKLG